MAAPTLLGHLALFGSLGSQAELLCTQGLAHLLRTYGEARAAMARMVTERAGVRVDGQVSWCAEVVQSDRSRPDLEACTAEGVPVVKVEAKLAADLGAEQLLSYFADLQRHNSHSALVVLVPARRRGEASKTTTAALGLDGPGPWPARAPHRPGVAVITWEELFATLAEPGSTRLAFEVEQLHAMYQVLVRAHVAQLAGVEDNRTWREHESVLADVVDQATRRLTTHHALYPMGSEQLAHGPEGLEPRTYRRRYVCRPHGASLAAFSIGVRESFARWITPDIHDFVSIRQRLEGSALRWLESGGELWLPIDVPLGVSGGRMVEAVIEQAEAAVRVAFRPESSA
jgi:hypothetical protein